MSRNHSKPRKEELGMKREQAADSYTSHMKWNPFLNAIAAAAYIVAVALFLQFIQSLRHATPDTLLDGVGMLSLVVFSAAVMAFLFFYQPMLKLTEHKHAEALSYFLTTLGIFGVITVALLTFVSLQ
jgi:hypothetical protein